MRTITQLTLVSALLTMSSLAVAQDIPSQLIDPPVTVTNNSAKTIEVITYADIPALKKISKHEQVVQPKQSATKKAGIDYYANSDSGTSKDQRNKILVMVYNNKTGKLLNVKTKTIDVYGSGAIKKDRNLTLSVTYSNNNKITLQLKSANRAKPNH